jgi:hypothetical protein
MLETRNNTKKQQKEDLYKKISNTEERMKII